MWIEYNPNPVGRRVGDCVVRALSKALDTDWNTAYTMAAVKGLAVGDMPSSDAVWGAVLHQNGFRREVIPNDMPMDYSVADFANDHPKGIFVLGIGGHVVTVSDGNIYDSWDSSNEIPQFVWFKKGEK